MHSLVQFRGVKIRCARVFFLHFVYENGKGGEINRGSTLGIGRIIGTQFLPDARTKLGCIHIYKVECKARFCIFMRK